MSETEAESPVYEPGVAILAIAPWLFPAGGEPLLGLMGTLAIGAGSVAYADVSARLEAPLGEGFGARVMAFAAPLLAIAAIALMLTPGRLFAGFALALVASAPRLLRSWKEAGRPSRTWTLFGAAVLIGAIYAHGVHFLRLRPGNLAE